MKKVLKFVKGRRDEKRDHGSLTGSFSMDNWALSTGQTNLSEEDHSAGVEQGFGYKIDLGGKDKTISKLHKAAWQGNLEKLKVNVKKIDIDSLDRLNRTPLHFAASQGHASVVWFLLNNKANMNICDNEGKTPFLKAIECGQKECVHLMLERSVDLNTVDYNGNSGLYTATKQGFYDIATMLLKQGANFEDSNNVGEFPLHIATQCEHKDLVELLLRYGSSVNVVDQDNRSPLMFAARSGNMDLVQLFLEYGAQRAVMDSNDWTAEDYALQNGHNDVAAELKTPSDTAVPLFAEMASDSEQKPNTVFPVKRSVSATSLPSNSHEEKKEMDINMSDRKTDDGDNSDTWNDSQISEPSSQHKMQGLKLTKFLPPSSDDEVSEESITSSKVQHDLKDEETQDSPRSCVIPPPCKPPRSWDLIQSGVIDDHMSSEPRRRSLLPLGSLRTKRESFTESPSLAESPSFHEDNGLQGDAEQWIKSQSFNKYDEKQEPTQHQPSFEENVSTWNDKNKDSSSTKYDDIQIKPGPAKEEGTSIVVDAAVDKTHKNFKRSKDSLNVSSSDSDWDSDDSLPLDNFLDTDNTNKNNTNDNCSPVKSPQNVKDNICNLSKNTKDLVELPNAPTLAKRGRFLLRAPSIDLTDDDTESRKDQSQHIVTTERIKDIEEDLSQKDASVGGTLGREGTMMGYDEVWEANPHIALSGPQSITSDCQKSLKEELEESMNQPVIIVGAEASDNFAVSAVRAPIKENSVGARLAVNSDRFVEDNLLYPSPRPELRNKGNSDLLLADSSDNFVVENLVEGNKSFKFESLSLDALDDSFEHSNKFSNIGAPRTRRHSRQQSISVLSWSKSEELHQKPPSPVHFDRMVVDNKRISAQLECYDEALRELAHVSFIKKPGTSSLPSPASNLPSSMRNQGYMSLPCTKEFIGRELAQSAIVKKQGSLSLPRSSEIPNIARAHSLGTHHIGYTSHISNEFSVREMPHAAIVRKQGSLSLPRTCELPNLSRTQLSEGYLSLPRSNELIDEVFKEIGQSSATMKRGSRSLPRTATPKDMEREADPVPPPRRRKVRRRAESEGDTTSSSANKVQSKSRSFDRKLPVVSKLKTSQQNSLEKKTVMDKKYENVSNSTTQKSDESDISGKAAAAIDKPIRKKRKMLLAMRGLIAPNLKSFNDTVSSDVSVENSFDDPPFWLSTDKSGNLARQETVIERINYSPKHMKKENGSPLNPDEIKEEEVPQMSPESNLKELESSNVFYDISPTCVKYLNDNILGGKSNNIDKLTETDNSEVNTSELSSNLDNVSEGIHDTTNPDEQDSSIIKSLEIPNTKSLQPLSNSLECKEQAFESRTQEISTHSEPKSLEAPISLDVQLPEFYNLDLKLSELSKNLEHTSTEPSGLIKVKVPTLSSTVSEEMTSSSDVICGSAGPQNLLNKDNSRLSEQLNRILPELLRDSAIQSVELAELPTDSVIQSLEIPEQLSDLAIQSVELSELQGSAIQLELPEMLMGSAVQSVELPVLSSSDIHTVESPPVEEEHSFDIQFALIAKGESKLNCQQTPFFNEEHDSPRTMKDSQSDGESGVSQNEITPQHEYDLKSHHAVLKKHLRAATSEKGRLEETAAELNKQAGVLKYKLANAEEASRNSDEMIVHLKNQLSKTESMYTLSLEELHKTRLHTKNLQQELQHLKDVCHKHEEEKNRLNEIIQLRDLEKLNLDHTLVEHNQEKLQVVIDKKEKEQHEIQIHMTYLEQENAKLINDTNNLEKIILELQTRLDDVTSKNQSLAEEKVVLSAKVNLGDPTLQADVVAWKEKYESTLNKLEEMEMSTVAMKELIRRKSNEAEMVEIVEANAQKYKDELRDIIEKMEKMKEQDCSMWQNKIQEEVNRAVLILKSEYIKVESALSKHNEKLEILVEKLQQDLEMSFKRQGVLESQLIETQNKLAGVTMEARRSSEDVGSARDSVRNLEKLKEVNSHLEKQVAELEKELRSQTEELRRKSEILQHSLQTEEQLKGTVSHCEEMSKENKELKSRLKMFKKIKDEEKIQHQDSEFKITPCETAQMESILITPQSIRESANKNKNTKVIKMQSTQTESVPDVAYLHLTTENTKLKMQVEKFKELSKDHEDEMKKTLALLRETKEMAAAMSAKETTQLKEQFVNKFQEQEKSLLKKTIPTEPHSHPIPTPSNLLNQVMQENGTLQEELQRLETHVNKSEECEVAILMTLEVPKVVQHSEETLRSLGGVMYPDSLQSFLPSHQGLYSKENSGFKALASCSKPSTVEFKNKIEEHLGNNSFMFLPQSHLLPSETSIYVNNNLENPEKKEMLLPKSYFKSVGEKINNDEEENYETGCCSYIDPQVYISSSERFVYSKEANTESKEQSSHQPFLQSTTEQASNIHACTANTTPNMGIKESMNNLVSIKEHIGDAGSFEVTKECSGGDLHRAHEQRRQPTGESQDLGSRTVSRPARDAATNTVPSTQNFELQRELYSEREKCQKYQQTVKKLKSDMQSLKTKINSENRKDEKSETNFAAKQNNGGTTALSGVISPSHYNQSILEFHRQVSDLEKKVREENAKRFALEIQVNKMRYELQEKFQLERELDNLRVRLDKDFVSRYELDQLRRNYEIALTQAKKEAELSARDDINTKIDHINTFIEKQVQEQTRLDQLRNTTETQMRQDFQNTRLSLLSELAKVQATLQAKGEEEKEFRQKCEKLARECEKKQDLRRKKLIEKSYNINLSHSSNIKEKELHLKGCVKDISSPIDNVTTAIQPTVTIQSALNPTSHSTVAITGQVSDMWQTDNPLSHMLRRELEKSIRKHTRTDPIVELPSSSTAQSTSDDHMEFLKNKYFLH